MSEKKRTEVLFFEKEKQRKGFPQMKTLRDLKEDKRQLSKY